jgi:hypothetical protein
MADRPAHAEGRPRGRQAPRVEAGDSTHPYAGGTHERPFVDRVDPDAVAKLVTVTSCSSRVEAQITLGALEAHGIQGVMFADDAGGVHPELSMLAPGGVRVAVDELDAEAARDLLEDLFRGDHALPDPGDHERVPVARASGWLTWLVASLLLAFLLYRAATLVIPGMG